MKGQREHVFTGIQQRNRSCSSLIMKIKMVDGVKISYVGITCTILFITATVLQHEHKDGRL